MGREEESVGDGVNHEAEVARLNILILEMRLNDTSAARMDVPC